MKTVLRGAWLIVVLLTLSACATSVDSKKLVADAAPVKDIDIAIWMGDLSSTGAASPSEEVFYRQTLRKALSSRLPAIFEANGVPVHGISFQELPATPDKLRAILEEAKSSHVLAITPSSAMYFTRDYTIRNSPLEVYFEANLWEVGARKNTWQATPVLSIFENQPFLRSQQFAAQLLEGLNQNGLIKLQHGVPVDLEGKEIGFIWSDASDK